MSNCSNCGAELPSGTNFCPGCGQQVMPGTSPMPPAGEVSPPRVPPFTTHKAKKGMSRGAKIALIVGLAVVALMIIIVILAVVLFVGVLSAPADVANDYVKSLNEGDLDTAWGYLSKAAQQEEGRSGFDSQMEDLEGEIESYNTSSIQVSDGEAEIVMNITLSGGEEGSWNMFLVKDGEDWKIQSVRER